jgi:hypothetical protein
MPDTKEEKAKKQFLRKIKKLIEEHPNLVMEALLDTPFWPQALDSEKDHRRYGDDNNSLLRIVFSRDGDAWWEVWCEHDPEEPGSVPRFRTYFGGGQSLRTRAALCILARAIDMDNAERPQQRNVSE